MSNKIKNRILLFAIILILFICYKWAILNTVNLKKEYSKLSKEAIFQKELPAQLSLLSKKDSYLDSILTSKNLGSGSLENNLLKILNVISKDNKVTVLDFNSPHVYMDNEAEISTFQFVLQGGFSSILNTAYELEQKNSFGEIVHLHFEKKKNYRTNKNYLNATIFLRHIK